jgi:Flp pilus assembly protein TadD
LKTLAAGVGAWARSPAAAPEESSAALPQVSTSSSAGEELRRQGIEKYGAGQAQAALDDFQAALTTAPLDAQTLASKAAILSTLGRDDEALAAYASALESARSDADLSSLMLAADILSSRATIFARRKDIANAVADLEDALRTAPPEWPRRKDALRRLKALKLRLRRTP